MGIHKAIRVATPIQGLQAASVPLCPQEISAAGTNQLSDPAAPTFSRRFCHAGTQ
jgi:hypothetical protein